MIYQSTRQTYGSAPYCPFLLFACSCPAETDNLIAASPRTDGRLESLSLVAVVKKNYPLCQGFIHNDSLLRGISMKTEDTCRFLGK
jgi:hypothetical protein